MIVDHVSCGQRDGKTCMRSLRCVETPGDEMGLGAGTVADGDELMTLQVSRPHSDPSSAAFWPFHDFFRRCFPRHKNAVINRTCHLLHMLVQLPFFQQPRRLFVLRARRLSLRGRPKSASQSNVHMQPICGLHSLTGLTQLMRLANDDCLRYVNLELLTWLRVNASGSRQELGTLFGGSEKRRGWVMGDKL